MERKNQICEAGQQYQNAMDEFQKYHTNPKAAFIDGAKWSDEHPDSKHTYTKQQLIDMGFAFTTNGDIVTPDQLNEDLKKYLEYQKRKFIEKGKEWIEKNFRSDGYFSLYYQGTFPYTPKNIAKDFCKAMEE